jgi:glycosyltransferase involved in cell wall biosynthesis
MHVVLCSFSNPHKTQWVSGAAIHLLLLERALKKNQIDLQTVYYDWNNPTEKLQSFLVECFTVFLPKPLKRMMRYKARLNRYSSYMQVSLKNHSFDVIHSNDGFALSVVQSDSKKILTLHGYLAKELIDEIGVHFGASALYSWVHRIESDAVKKADHIIAVDDRIRDYAVKELGCPSSKITVVYNAVDTDCFAPVSKTEQKQFKTALGFNADEFVILVPRRLVLKNGVIYAVKSMTNIPYSNVRLVLVGDGPERESVLKAAVGDNRIIWAGALPHTQLAAYFKAADAIMVPSITSYGVQEATSLAALEGMSCGKLVICTNVGGLKQIVNEDRGLIVEEGNPASIAAAVCRAIRNELSCPIETLTKNAREYVVNNHSYISHAKKIIAVYNKKENALD